MPISDYLTEPQVKSTDFPDDYVQEVFLIWYKAGRPRPKELAKLVPEYGWEHKKPDARILGGWVDSLFLVRAMVLDEQVAQALDSKLIGEKVEMFNRHVSIAMDMQQKAIDYLNDHAKDLGTRNAIRLLEQGIKIERQSRGVPTLVGIAEQTDDKLMNQLKQLVSGSPVVDIEAVDEDEVEDAE